MSYLEKTMGSNKVIYSERGDLISWYSLCCSRIKVEWGLIKFSLLIR